MQDADLTPSWSNVVTVLHAAAGAAQNGTLSPQVVSPWEKKCVRERERERRREEGSEGAILHAGAGAAQNGTLSPQVLLLTDPRRSLRLRLSDTRVYEPQIRAHLGTTAHF